MSQSGEEPRQLGLEISDEQRNDLPPLEAILVVSENLRDVPVSRAGFTTFTSNALVRNGVSTIGDLDGVSVETLTKFYRFGTKSISEVFAHLSTVLPEPAPDMPSVFPSCPARLSGFPVGALGVRLPSMELLRESGFETLGDLCGAPSSVLAQVPDVAERLSSLLDGAYDPSLLTADTLQDELAVLLARCGLRDAGRDRAILEMTCGLLPGDCLTLEEAGQRLGLTRERVRQLRARADERLRWILRWLLPPSVNTVRLELAGRHGLARLTELMPVLGEVILPGRYDPGAYLGWLLPLVGDPSVQLVDGGLIIGPPVGRARYTAARELLKERLAGGAPLQMPEAIALVAPIWIPEERVRQEVLEAHVRLLLSTCAQEPLPNVFAAERWRKVDWAEWVLRDEGGPLHFHEVAVRVSRLTGKHYDEVGFNGVLNTDTRFARVGAGDFSLAEWGIQSYGRFDEVVERYLAERGQPEHEQRIIDDLLSMYTVQESTIMAMLNTHRDRFSHLGGGYWGLANVAYPVDPELELELAGQLANAGTSLTVDELRRRVVFARKDTRPLPSEAVLRVLYGSPKFQRVRTTSPARFALVSTASP